MRIGYATRERDEELLDWITLWESGMSYGAIARRYGRNSGVVSTAIKRVLREAE